MSDLEKSTKSLNPSQNADDNGVSVGVGVAAGSSDIMAAGNTVTHTGDLHISAASPRTAPILRKSRQRPTDANSSSGGDAVGVGVGVAHSHTTTTTTTTTATTARPPATTTTTSTRTSTSMPTATSIVAHSPAGGGAGACAGGSDSGSGSGDASAPASSYPLVVYCFASFHQICVVTALLPLVTLFTCFVTAYVFQYDEVHETHCRVYNIIPSISAITGISPQRYFWRFSIALHIGPRLPIAFVYKNYYRILLADVRALAAHQRTQANYLIKLILVLNCIEVVSLGGVTYISNRENYPIHEKIFITFMVCSLCYMLATIKLTEMLHDDPAKLTREQRESLRWKKILFVLSILSTVGLLVFFAKHRFYCHDLAFSWFAFFEYLIAIANMLFHFTIIWDFPSQYMLVVQGSRAKLEQILGAPSKNL